MNIAQIEEQIQKLSRKVTPESFIYDLLGAYGKPKACLLSAVQCFVGIDEAHSRGRSLIACGLCFTFQGSHVWIAPWKMP